MKIEFSLDRYDKDGDIWERGIYLHIGPFSVRLAHGEEGLKALDAIVESIKCIRAEIVENDEDYREIDEAMKEKER